MHSIFVMEVAKFVVADQISFFFKSWVVHPPSSEVEEGEDGQKYLGHC